MSDRLRRNFSPREKAEILREHLKEKKPVSEICDKYSIHPTVFHRWHAEVLENFEVVFERKGKQKDPGNTRLEQKVTELEKKLHRKNEVLSELMEEHVALKKTLGEN